MEPVLPQPNKPAPRLAFHLLTELLNQVQIAESLDSKLPSFVEVRYDPSSKKIFLKVDNELRQVEVELPGYVVGADKKLFVVIKGGAQKPINPADLIRAAQKHIFLLLEAQRKSDRIAMSDAQAAEAMVAERTQRNKDLAKAGAEKAIEPDFAARMCSNTVTELEASDKKYADPIIRHIKKLQLLLKKAIWNDVVKAMEVGQVVALSKAIEACKTIEAATQDLEQKQEKCLKDIRLAKSLEEGRAIVAEYQNAICDSLLFSNARLVHYATGEWNLVVDEALRRETEIHNLKFNDFLKADLEELESRDVRSKMFGQVRAIAKKWWPVPAVIAGSSLLGFLAVHEVERRMGKNLAVHAIEMDELHQEMSLTQESNLVLKEYLRSDQRAATLSISPLVLKPELIKEARDIAENQKSESNVLLLGRLYRLLHKQSTDMPAKEGENLNYIPTPSIILPLMRLIIECKLEKRLAPELILDKNTGIMYCTFFDGKSRRALGLVTVTTQPAPMDIVPMFNNIEHGALPSGIKLEGAKGYRVALEIELARRTLREARTSLHYIAVADGALLSKLDFPVVKALRACAYGILAKHNDDRHYEDAHALFSDLAKKTGNDFAVTSLGNLTVLESMHKKLKASTVMKCLNTIPATNPGYFTDDARKLYMLLTVLAVGESPIDAEDSKMISVKLHEIFSSRPEILSSLLVGDNAQGELYGLLYLMSQNPNNSVAKTLVTKDLFVKYSNIVATSVNVSSEMAKQKAGLLLSAIGDYGAAAKFLTNSPHASEFIRKEWNGSSVIPVKHSNFIQALPNFEPPMGIADGSTKKLARVNVQVPK